MEVRLLACCETSIQDVRTNNLSLIAVIDEVAAAAFPVALTKCSLVALLSRSHDEPETVPIRVRGSLNNQGLFDQEFMLEFQGKFKARAIVDMNGILVASAGVLRDFIMMSES